MRPFYVTTPIYYVNDAPHIGHAYTSVAADCLARWFRLNGRQVRFLTGTDEHGQKVLRAAEKLGRTPQAHADATHQRFRALWTRLRVDYDDFIRTTEPRHQDVVRALLTRLHDTGLMYADAYSGWYSTSAERFWTDDEVVAGTSRLLDKAVTSDDLRGTVTPLCPDTGTPVEWITEKNWFFKMSTFQDRLIDHIERHPLCIQPDTRRNEVLGYLRKPLGDLCISRPKARLPWGIPLPFDPDYVTYVWFDALTNYVSALGGDGTVEFKTYWPEALHLVGKDILTFHTVYWFAMLMACGITPPKQVYAHGWWLMTGRKMSKSIGNVVAPDALIDAYGADTVRYFLLAAVPFGADGEFSHEAFLLKTNSDLANDFGNLAHRVLTMTEKWLGAAIAPRGPETEADRELREVTERAVLGFGEQMELCQFRAALESLWTAVRAGNTYLERQEPWGLNKRGETERLGTVLRNAAELVRIAGSHLACVCPERASELLSRLGLASPDLSTRFDRLTAGTAVQSREPLFPRFLEIPESLVSEPAVPALSAPAAAETLPQITYDDFTKVQLRTGTVLSAEKHPKADRLLVLQVDVGEGAPRQIVAGIAAVYAPEDLVGKSIIVVVNLAPAKLRGIESQGMLLAAGGSDIASILTPLRPVPAGSVVK